MALNGHGVGVGELDLDVFLLYACQFTIKKKGIWKLDKIILWTEYCVATTDADK